MFVSPAHAAATLTDGRFQRPEHVNAINAALLDLTDPEHPCRRLAISAPPRHGKSELASKLFPTWYMGLNPTHSTISATYNQEFAGDFGRKVREIMQSRLYHHVFPNTSLKVGSASASNGPPVSSTARAK